MSSLFCLLGLFLGALPLGGAAHIVEPSAGPDGSEAGAPLLLAADTAGTATGVGKAGGRVHIVSARGRFRREWTVELGLGGGFQTRDVDGGESTSGAVLAGPSFGAGYFLSDWVALMVRSVNTWAFPDDTAPGAVIPSGFAGAAAQLWPFDWLHIEAGIGLGYHLDAAEDSADLGIALLGQLGVPVWQRQDNAIQLAVTYTPMWLDRSFLQAGFLAVVWQHF